MKHLGTSTYFSKQKKQRAKIKQRKNDRRNKDQIILYFYFFLKRDKLYVDIFLQQENLVTSTCKNL